MVLEHEIVLMLLQSAFTGRQCTPPGNADWERVIRFASHQRVLGICLDAVQMLPRGLAPEKRILCKWLLTAEKNKAAYERRQKLAAYFSAELEKEGVRFHVLKGMAFARYYSCPELRYSEDIDCLLSDYEKGNSVAARLGGSVDSSQQRHSQIRLKGVLIENHRTCTHLDIDGLEDFLAGILSRSERGKSDSGALELPPLEFDALFALYHARVHFVLEKGIFLQHVTDWIMIRKELERNGLMESVGATCLRFHMQKFLDAFNGVADMVEGKKRYEDLTVSERLMWEDTVKERTKTVHKNRWLVRRVRMLVHKFRNGWKYRMYTDTTAWKDVMKSIGRYIARVCGDPRVLKYVFGRK